jgi:hypothetical protein
MTRTDAWGVASVAGDQLGGVSVGQARRGGIPSGNQSAAEEGVPGGTHESGPAGSALFRLFPPPGPTRECGAFRVPNTELPTVHRFFMAISPDEPPFFILPEHSLAAFGTLRGVLLVKSTIGITVAGPATFS